VLATERAGPSLDVLASNLKNNQASTSGRAQAHALDWAQRGAVQQLLRQLNVVPHMAMASGTCVVAHASHSHGMALGCFRLSSHGRM
jgi:hypothetical protein